MPTKGFPKRYHLRHRLDFKRTYEFRRSVADGCLILYACPNGLQESRIGLSVSRKFGNAVARNRWKRLIREAFRLHREEFPAGLDFIVLPKRGAELPGFIDVENSLKSLMKRIRSRLKKTSV